MSARASFRSQLVVGSVLWTVGLLVLVSISAIMFLAHNPRPHLAVIRAFIAVPPAVWVAIGVACMAGGVLQIRRSLVAVGQLGIRLTELHRGIGRQVAGDYPAEVQPLVDALNALLTEREQRVERAVAKAGDLAHGLKTPLAVLSRDADRAADGGDTDLAASMRTQIDRMCRQIDYHLAHARATADARLPGVRCFVAASVDGLVRTLKQAYAERAITFEQAVTGAHVVRCAREDLDEILGNLLDNACKWCRSRVRVASTASADSVAIVVEDDGQGLEPALTSVVLQRGVRADERVPGFGLGLAISRDLVESYGGSIELTTSALGGLRARACLPSAENL